MPPSDRPNVLFVLSDQHRASALGCAGNDDVHTPNLDALSEAGTRFERAYANYPVCTPSRGCLISGQYPIRNGAVANDLPLSTDVPSVGEAFRDAGYRTGFVGKWHLDGVPRSKFTPPGPRRHGFDDFWAVYNCAHDYYNTKYYRDDSDELIRVEGYEPEVQTDLALEFLDAEDDRPFCLFLSWGPPHDPYELVPGEYRERYDPDDLTLRENAAPIMPGAPNNPETGTLDGPPVREWGPLTSEDYETGWRYEYDDQREILADYYAAITALDDQFGRLVDALDDRGLADDTILSYTSDHGDMLFSHGMNQKGYPHEESVGIPFLIRWPGEVPAGVENDTLVSIVDVGPSLLGLAGIDPPDAMQGTDLSDAVSDPTVEGPDSVYIMGSNWRGVRTARYTYARVPTSMADFQHIPGGRWLLFDNEADPYQYRNVVLDPEYADVVERLDREVDAWLERTDDPFVSVEETVRRLGLVEEWNARVDWHKGTQSGGLEDSFDYLEAE